MDIILNAPYHHQGDGLFSPGPHPDRELRVSDLTRRIRRLLRFLISHDTRDIKRSGAAFRDTTTYEDIFFLCQQIRDWNIGLSDNSLTTPFMEYIENRAHGLLLGHTVEARMSDLATLGKHCCYFIESVVAETLNHKYLGGLNLILELANSPEMEQLNIVTLNHDTLVEQFLTANGVEFVDGFGEPDGDVRWSDDSLYDLSGAHVRVFKLHGSINWYSFAFSGDLRTAIFLGTSVWTAKDGGGKQFQARTHRPSFLSGINKAIRYQQGIYADIHFRFLELLRHSDRILMSGYGWSDAAINLQLDTWLDRFRRNTIILLHERPEEIPQKSLIMGNSYDLRVRTGQLIRIKRWLCDVSLSDIKTSLLSSAQGFNLDAATPNS